MNATSAPQMTGWRQMTHRSRSMKNRPTPMPPTTYSSAMPTAEMTPMASFADRMLRVAAAERLGNLDEVGDFRQPIA